MDSISVKGYKSFQDVTVSLNKINILIGSNGSGKSNFLSLFELLGASYDGRLAQYVALCGGVDKLLYKGRKITERININVREDKNSYDLSLMESDGGLLVESEKIGYSSRPTFWTLYEISRYRPETVLKDYNGMTRGEYIKKYMSQIKKFHFHDTGRKSPFTGESNILNDSPIDFIRMERI